MTMKQDCLSATLVVGGLVASLLLVAAPIPAHSKPLGIVVVSGKKEGVWGTRTTTTTIGEHLRQLIPLEGFGGTPNAMYMPLGECQGDCDDDDDCKSGLKCFQREPGDSVPGCEGGEDAMSRTDYCVQSSYASSSASGSSSSSSDSSSHHHQDPESNDSGNGSELVGLGADPETPTIPLDLCEGDCDSDKDCKGNLICYQRDPGWPVPGCVGNSESRTDFCIEHPDDRNSGGSDGYIFTTESDANAIQEEESAAFNSQQSSSFYGALMMTTVLVLLFDLA